MKRLKLFGQINIIAAIGIGASILIATISGYISQAYRTDTKIQNVQTQTIEVRERTAKLETAVETIQKDTRETRDDIKQLIRELRNRK